MPARPPAEQRLALLTAGHRILEAEGLSGFSVATACAAAGVSERSFKRHFADRDAFLCALAEQFLDEARDVVTRLTDNMPAGIGRLKLSLETYLAANLQRPALREIMRELRSDERAESLMRRRLTGFTMMTQLELKRARWPNAEITARLLTAAALETIYAEFEARRALPECRDLLFRYLDSLG